MEIPSQKKLLNSIKNVPVEYFRWGVFPDHFKIESPHRHEFDELLFISKGGGLHDIDFQEYEIKDWSVHYIPRATIHYLRRSTESVGFTIAFDTTYLEQNDIHRIVSPFSMAPFILNLTEKSFREIIQITNIIYEQIKMNSGYYKTKCFLLSLELLLNRLISEERHSQTNGIEEDALVKRFRVLLRANIHRHQSVNWYAKELHVSPKSISNRLKKEIGMSAKSLITSELLISVKKMLINSGQSIKQIAHNHEMDLSSLGKLFKKHVGCSMMDYRTEYK